MTVSLDGKNEEIRHLELHFRLLFVVPNDLVRGYSYSPAIGFIKTHCKLSSRFKLCNVSCCPTPTYTKLMTEVSHNIFDNIAFILPYSTLFSKVVRSLLGSSRVIFDNPFNASSPICPENFHRSKYWHVVWHFCKYVHLW